MRAHALEGGCLHAGRCLDDEAMTRFTIAPFDGREWEDSVDRIR
jgi:hypothetical protein